MSTQIKLNWDLEKFFFSSPTDPKLEEEIQAFEALAKEFSAKYGTNKAFLSDPKLLREAIEDFEKLCVESKASLYLNYLTTLNSYDTKAEATANLVDDRLTKASNLTIFFLLDIASINEANQAQMLAAVELKEFRYFLEETFRGAKYNLTEAEEKILSLKSTTSYDMWVQGVEKSLSKQTIPWKGQLLPISEAQELVGTIPSDDSNELHQLVMGKLQEMGDFAEAEINAVYTDKKIDDELRGFTTPYAATLLEHETTEEMVLALIKAVTNNNAIAKKFFGLKAKILNQDHLTYADRNASIGETQTNIPFVQGCKIVDDAFKNMDPEFSRIFQNFLANGQIDVFPKQGKAGGAFCASNIDSPTLVLLNHVDNMESITTLAHEMGHAIHSEFSKTQRPLYQDYSTVVAEVASTFFEQVVFYNTLATLTPSEQIVALHDKINQDIMTIFRQVAFFNFELDLHTEIRKEGSVTKARIAELLNKHTSTYMGEAMQLTEADGYYFVTLSHMRNYFYVYSYAYGCLVSKALYQKYANDKSYITSIKAFLSAGSSASPQEIFSQIGIDTTDVSIWELGLQTIKDDIEKLERLTTTEVKQK